MARRSRGAEGHRCEFTKVTGEFPGRGNEEGVGYFSTLDRKRIYTVMVVQIRFRSANCLFLCANGGAFLPLSEIGLITGFQFVVSFFRTLTFMSLRILAFSLLIHNRYSYC